MNESRNPYIDVNCLPTLKKSVVAYIDILGFTELLKSATPEESQQRLIKLHETLHKAWKDIEPNPNCGLTKIYDKDRYAIRAFSDNILIGYPIPEDEDVKFILSYVFYSLSFFQMKLAIENLFLRGAVTIENLYMDNMMVYGLGLINAYEAESNLASNPRIILTQCIENLLDMREFNGEYILRDTNDDLYFVHYLSTAIAEDGRIYKHELLKHKEEVEKNLRNHKNNPRNLSKYKWVANYHNSFCYRNSCIDPKLKINANTFNLSQDC